MTTMEFNAAPAGRGTTAWRWFGRLCDRIMMWREDRARRDAVMVLSHLDARLLRDIGIEPQDVIDALNQRRGNVWLEPMRHLGDRR